MSKYYGVLLIVVLVAVSGVIAYVGDIVGRRMGRKRLSLFGLRPRHTAIVISVIAGMLITVVTLGAAMAVSENVRLGILRVGPLRAEIKSLRTERRRLTKEVTSGEQALGKTRAELTEREKQLTEEQAKLAEAQKARQVAEGGLARTSKSFADLTQRKAQLDQDIKEREGRLAFFEWAVEKIAARESQTVIFDAGQPLSVLGVEPGQAPAAIRKRLDAFLAQLDAAVQKAGAKAEGPSKPAAMVVHYERDPKTGQRVLVDAGHVLDGLVTNIQESFRKDPSLKGIVVQASVVRNARPGEPVWVDFGIFPNALVFSKGTKLGDVVIPAGAPRGKVGEGLTLLLKGRVRAVSEGRVIARLDPSLPHAGSQGGNVGSGVTWDEVFAVADRVAQIRGPVRITAIAKDDTWTIGPLNVDFRVEPAGA